MQYPMMTRTGRRLRTVALEARSRGEKAARLVLLLASIVAGMAACAAFAEFFRGLLIGLVR